MVDDADVDIRIHPKGTGNVQLYSDDDGTAPLTLSFWKNSASPADGDRVGNIQFFGEDDASNSTTYARIQVRITDQTNSGSTEDGEMEFWTCRAGSEVETLTLDSGKVTKIGNTAPSVASGGSILRWDGSAWEPSEVSTIGLANISTVTSDPSAAATASGSVYVFNKASAGVFTLPSAPPTGTQFVIINKTANDVVITRSGSDTINGSTTVTNTTQYAATTCVYAGSNLWYAFGGI